MTTPEISSSGAPVYPSPPGMQWYWLLGLGFVTGGVFWSIWPVYLSLWLLSMNRQRKEITVLTLFSLLAVIASFDFIELVHGISAEGWRYFMIQHPSTTLSGTIEWITIILYLVAIFMMRSLLERHYREVEPIGLSLSGVMTFFFGVWYFQYHLHDIAEFRRRQASTLIA